MSNPHITPDYTVVECLLHLIQEFAFAATIVVGLVCKVILTKYMTRRKLRREQNAPKT